MKIAPIDIAHKTFTKKLMGIDEEEVSEFLRGIAEEMERLIREKNQLKESMREKELAIHEYRDRDQMMKKTIETATRMAEKIKEDSDREARLVLEDAKQKADLIIRDARDSLKSLYREISDLKRARLQFENNLRAMVKAHLAMVEQGKEFMPDPAMPNANQQDLQPS